MIVEVLGEGTHAIVYSCKNDDNHVIKRHKSSMLIDGISIKELACLCSLKHEGIPTIDPKNIFMTDDNIHVKLKKLRCIERDMFVCSTNENIRIFLLQLSSTLEYIHLLKINHRDINPSNIMFDIELKWYQLNDWGSSSIIEHGIRPGRSTTQCFLPPEWLMYTDSENGACDIWALALTILMIWYPMEKLYDSEDWKVLLFYFYDEFSVIRSIREEKILKRTKNELDVDVTGVLIDMLDFNPVTRITASQIIDRLLPTPRVEDPQTQSVCVKSTVAQTMKKWIQIQSRMIEISNICMRTAYNIIDKLVFHDDDISDFKLTTSSCVIISNAIHDEHMKYKEWVEHCNGCFTENDLLDTVKRILIILDFNLL